MALGMNDEVVVPEFGTFERSALPEQICARFLSLIEDGVKKFVINLHGVPWINSTGLGILISGYSTLRRSGGELKLLKVSDRIENIFIVSKLYTVFESFSDEEEAIRSFS